MESRFQNHPYLVILQKYQSLSNQSFKHNSAHMPSLNLTLRFLLNLGFVCSSLMVTTEKTNACGPWTFCFSASRVRNISASHIRDFGPCHNVKSTFFVTSSSRQKTDSTISKNSSSFRRRLSFRKKAMCNLV